MRFLPLIIFALLCGLLLMQITAPPESLQGPSQEEIASWPVGKQVPRILLPLVPKEPTAPSVASMPLNFAQAGVAQKGGYLINLFASWCQPCVAEMPHLQKLSKEHGVVIVGVAWKDSPQALSTFFKRYGRPFAQVLLDVDGKAITEFGSTAIPETFLVDSTGVIRKRYRGNLQPRHVEEITQALEEFAKENPSSATKAE
jgi:cytochrome c biogenesis protein CcmG/thiol:disulfide interchange protein DsbE